MIQRVAFIPVDSFWPEPGASYPMPGTRGTIIAVPPPGTLGGCVTVRWDSGGVCNFCGRNSESLRWI